MVKLIRQWSCVFVLISVVPCRRRDQASVSRLLSEARKVQLLIQLYNGINCWFVQGVKVASLVSAILNGYLGIRLRQDNILITAFCAIIYVYGIVGYCGAFNRAYRLQELQKVLKGELKSACAKRSARAGYMVVKESFKAANALSCPGLRVGRFHEMERQSALIFIDFVQRQIISLLVAF